MIKKSSLSSKSIFSVLWRLVTFTVRRKALLLSPVIESKGRAPKDALRSLFAKENSLSLNINERYLALVEGEYPRHKLAKHQDFFISNLADCKRIVALGGGYGAVVRSVALTYPNSTNVGIDNDLNRLSQASQSRNLDNVSFELLDIYDLEDYEAFDGAILPNVLEHVENRIEFLKAIRLKTRIKKLLVRVPDFQRHLSIPLRRNFGVNYFQDAYLKIEHTVTELRWEVQQARFAIKNIFAVWGENWTVCTPTNE